MSFIDEFIYGVTIELLPLKNFYGQKSISFTGPGISFLLK